MLRTAIIVLCVCVVASLAVSIYMLRANIVTTGFADDTGSTSQLNSYDMLFITVFLFAMLIMIIIGGRKLERKKRNM